MVIPDRSIRSGDALLVVDVQVDFCPGGALPIPEGDTVVPLLNRWIETALQRGIPVYYSRDWHPVRHVSFREQGGEWPPHCLQDSEGARFHPDLLVPSEALLVTKGVRLDKDQNSAFDETGLAAQLRRDGVSHLWVGGLALDVCVKATVLDALRLGALPVVVLRNATRAVDRDGAQAAEQAMREAGARVEESS
ncbi:MAG: isochorismatase family protein [Deferrisomatales bacterium]|nr:isochorismatase family protein [Deferrisomatales bacterium]